MNKRDWPELLRPYWGEWIALDRRETRVVASAPTLDQLMAVVRRRKAKDVRVWKVEDLAAFVPAG